MSDKVDKPTIIAGFVALAAVLGLALLASSAVYPDGWNRDGHQTTARMKLWLGGTRHCPAGEGGIVCHLEYDARSRRLSATISPTVK